MVSTAILGASGYAGQETLDRVLSHQELRLVALGSDSLAGQPASALDLRLNGHLPAFVPNEEALAAGAELLFVCLDHEQAAALEPPPDAVVVDLSGAHRLRAAGAYSEWYGFEHPRRDSLADPDSVVVDAKSGVSGAGRALKVSSQAAVVLANVAPYRVGTHQHEPEIEQALGFPVCFVPHLVPVRRGLIATCYVRSRGEDLRGLLEAAYATSKCVRVLPEGIAPEFARVHGTDAAEIGVFIDNRSGRTIVICALDNLGKGAAGQAMQNANLALGLEHTLGLRLGGVLV
jgi:N-acetyl-gamma-glutamyl-phosphate reductase